MGLEPQWAGLYSFHFSFQSSLFPGPSHVSRILGQRPIGMRGIMLWVDFCSSPICLQCRRSGLYSRVRKIPWRREWLPTWAFLPGKFHGQRSLVSYSPWCRKESDTTEQLTVSQTIFSFCRNIQIYGQTDIQWDRQRSINNGLYLVAPCFWIKTTQHLGQFSGEEDRLKAP